MQISALFDLYTILLVSRNVKFTACLHSVGIGFNVRGIGRLGVHLAIRTVNYVIISHTLTARATEIFETTRSIFYARWKI